MPTAEAKANAAKLEELKTRISGCSLLFMSAAGELSEKILRILNQQDALHRRIDTCARDRKERVALAGSAKVERAAQDLEAVVDSAKCIIKDLRLLSADDGDDDGDDDDDDDDHRRRRRKSPSGPLPSPQGQPAA